MVRLASIMALVTEKVFAAMYDSANPCARVEKNVALIVIG